MSGHTLCSIYFKGSKIMSNSGIFGLPLWVVLVVYIAAIAWLFYFVGRISKRNKKRISDMQESVRRGDKISTIGGIIGTVTRRSADGILTICIDEEKDVHMDIYLTAVQRVLSQNLIDEDPVQDTH